MKFLTTSLAFTLALAAPGLNRKRDSCTTGYTGSDNATDITDGVCAPLTVIFARGTGEPGNIGGVVGPPMFSDLSTLLNGSVALQGVNYAADINGDLDGGAEGSPNMTSLFYQAKSHCPGTKIALGGYSQGGLVTHFALNTGAINSSDVSAIVLFGDPELHGQIGTVSPSIIKEYCATGDGVCESGGFNISAAHVSYGANASDAANFIIKTTGVTLPV